jgi:hypothetical protein
MSIKFNNVIPFPTQERREKNDAQLRHEDKIFGPMDDFDTRMEVILEQAKQVEKLSEELLNLAEDMLRNPDKYD